MTLSIFTDGGSRSNPGPAASAYVMYIEGKELLRHAESIGVATNNAAEYTALIRALEKVVEFVKSEQIKNVTSISVISDSLLMVSQVRGLYKIKNNSIFEYVQKVHALEAQINVPISYTHVLREKNTVADSLVKSVLK
jgi:ribonuclease HI